LFGIVSSMTNTYNTVFFDWGGVVADDPGDEFLGNLLRQLGATEPQIQEIFQNYMKRFMRGQISESEYWGKLKANYGFSISDTISQEFMKWTGLKANTSILDLVDSTKAQGLKTAIFSNVIEPTYNVLDAAGYYDRFDTIVASCKTGYAKPEKEIYNLALDMLNTIGAKSIFIDDKESNLIPARELGFTTILAVSPKQIISDLNKLLM
jgi:putative hydrolase of the HAD superfamily